MTEKLNLAETDRLLDKLAVFILESMQEHVHLKIDIEKTMQVGEGGLVKSRYIMGHSSVCSLQIPNREGAEYRPLSTLNRCENGAYLLQDMWQLNVADTEEDKSLQNPIKWYGVLVPREMHLAQDAFKKSLELCVEAANVQVRLQKMMQKYVSLKAYKKALIEDS